MRPKASLLVALVLMGSALTASTRLPLIAFDTVEPITQSRRTEQSQRALLEGIAAWLAIEFDLPATKRVPTLRAVAPTEMAALRYHGLAPTGSDAGDLLALYERSQRTIYLPVGWRGATPAEVSILVHEMVHYLQELAGHAYECVEDRERLAYRAQDRWLVLAGSSLEIEFGVDAFTVLARSTCLH